MILALVLFSLGGNANADDQALSNKVGVGANVGFQKLFSDDPHTGMAPSGEGYLRLMLSNRFNFTFGLGYGLLSDGSLVDKSTYTTNMIVGDVRGNLVLSPTGKYRPYLSLGLGIHNWQYSGKTYSKQSGKRVDPKITTDRFFDAHSITGGGIEIFMNPKLAFNALADYRMVLTEPADYFDGRISGSKDSYLNLRAGLTYYFNDQFKAQTPGEQRLIANAEEAGSDIFGDSSPFSESGSDKQNSEKFAVFESKIDRLENNEANFTMEQYVQLKSRVDELRNLIDQRSSEIDNLKTSLDFKDSQMTDLEDELKRLESHSQTQPSASYRPKSNYASNYGSSGSGSGSGKRSDDFNLSYEAALQDYYANNFSKAIQAFEELIRTQPNHKLTSNCQYWVGEAYFAMGNFSQAVPAFKKVLDYSNSYKKDDSMLMLGKTFMKMNDYASARQYFEILIRDFPDSEYTSRAESFLSKLN